MPICPCFAGAVEFFLSVRVQLLLQQKEHTINHSFPWARSVLQSVSRSSSFLPSYLPSFMHSLYQVPRCPCFAGAVEFLLSVRFQLLLQRKVHQSINHSFWARSVSQSLFCSSSFLPSFKWVPRYPCFAGAVEFLLSVRAQLLLQSKADQPTTQSIIRSGLVRSLSQ